MSEPEMVPGPAASRAGNGPTVRVAPPPAQAARLFEQREEVEARLGALRRRYAAAEADTAPHEALSEQARQLSEELQAKDGATTLEWLRLRVAEVDEDVSWDEYWLELARLDLEISQHQVEVAELTIRIDQAAEDRATGVLGTGREHEVEMLSLHLQEAVLNHASSVARVDLIGRRLKATEELRRDLKQALRDGEWRCQNASADDS